MIKQPRSRRDILKTAAGLSAAATLGKISTTRASAATETDNKQALSDIDRDLRQATEAKNVAGVVAMAATDNGVLYQGAFGKRDLAKGVDMTPDSVFWIASMTKAITAAAAMQLVEQGKAAA
jgi:methyl acetate hydrolase